MGRLTYDTTTRVDMDDVILAHLQVVIGTKLHRREPFMLTWRNDAELGDGRISVWINPANTLTFKLFQSEHPSLDREMLEHLLLEASRPNGLYIARHVEAGSHTYSLH